MLKISHIVFEHTVPIFIKRPYAILLVSTGDGVLRIDNQEAELVAGRTFFLKERQEVYFVGNVLIGHLLHFQPSLLESFLFQNTRQRNKGLFDPKRQLAFTDHSTDTFIFFLCLIGHLLNELEQRTIIAGQYFFLFLRLVNRRIEELMTVLPENEFMMERLMMLIEGNYKKHRNTSFYAQEMATTKRRLNVASWAQHDKKFFDLVTDRVIAEADLLLMGTRMQIKDIAFELGFKDQSNFTTFYTRATGMSPSEKRSGK